MAQRIPPHSEEAERSVLGACMLRKEVMFTIVETLDASDFYNRINMEVFEAIKALYLQSKPVDYLTVSEELRRRNSLDMVGGIGFLAEIVRDVPATSNAEEYAKIISEKAALRELITVSSDIVEKGYDDTVDVEQIIDYAEKSILDVGQSRQSKDFVSIKDIIMYNINRFSELSENEGKLTGLTTGFIDLDNKLQGLQKSDMIIIAARPSMGKTALALNIAQNAAVKANASVIIFSLEMDRNRLGQRLIASESRTDLTKLNTGAILQKDWERIQLAVDKIAATKMVIDDSAESIMEMKNKCRRLKAEKGLDLVVIDYLQLMEAKGKVESRTQEISAISRSIKQLAREMECPVIVLSQLSRGVESRTDKRPMMSDLRESGQIEQDADVIMLLYRDDYYNKESEKANICEVNIAKHRNGEIGVVELMWQPQFTKFNNKAQGGS